jgi:hypothetical protein
MTAGWVWRGPSRSPAPGSSLSTWPRLIHSSCAQGCRRGRAGYRQAMTRTERLTERAITFAIAEADEGLAVARLAFLAHGDHDTLDAAIDACLAGTERTLYTRWRAISFLVRVRYEDQPTSEQPVTFSASRSNGGKGSAPRNSRDLRRDDQPG